MIKIKPEDLNLNSELNIIYSPDSVEKITFRGYLLRIIEREKDEGWRKKSSDDLGGYVKEEDSKVLCDNLDLEGPAYSRECQESIASEQFRSGFKELLEECVG
jgi:hypothetical protein